MKKKWILGIMLSLCLGLIGGMAALTYDFVTPPNQTEEKASAVADTFPTTWSTDFTSASVGIAVTACRLFGVVFD